MAGIVVVLGALAGEQQRPSVQQGLRGRLRNRATASGSRPGSPDLGAVLTSSVNRPRLCARRAATAS